MRRLHVLQLLPALDAGGVERSTLEIASALVQSGHRATVVSAGGRLQPALEATGARHVTLPIGRKSPSVLATLPALRAALADADIVHARSRLPAWMAVMALGTLPAARRPRLVTTVHGLNSPGPYSAVLTRGERVICVSDSVREYVLRQWPATPPQRLVVIPRGIDPAAYPCRPAPDAESRRVVAARAPALAGDGPLLMLPGRGTRLKGHADAIALLSRLRAEGLDARLWLPGVVQHGREAYADELRACARDAGLDAVVQFDAPVGDMATAYAACDLVLQLSRKPEAFGRTVIEALAVGRPVLGWAHGGVGDLLAQLFPQGAVEPFAIDGLAARAGGLLARPPALPSTMPFTLRAMQEATLAVYESVVAG